MNAGGLFLGLAKKITRKPAPVAGRDNNAAGRSVRLAGRDNHTKTYSRGWQRQQNGDLLMWLAETTTLRPTPVAGRDNHMDRSLVVGKDNHAARGPSPVVGRDKIARV